MSYIITLLSLLCRRISHRTHHQNHGHVENDESWHPVSCLSIMSTSLFLLQESMCFYLYNQGGFCSLCLFYFDLHNLHNYDLQLSEKIYKNLDKATQMLRFTLPFPMLAYPFYLVSILLLTSQFERLSCCFQPFSDTIVFMMIQLQWGRSPGKKGSHFDPNSDLFLPRERKDIITSTACWTAMAALLVCLSFVMGPVQVLKLYGIPYWVCSKISLYFDVIFHEFGRKLLMLI